MVPGQRIIPAHLRLHIMNAANILILPRQLAQPWAADDVLAGSRMYPDIADARNHFRDPSKNIVPSVLLPPGDILSRCARMVSIEIKTTIAALLTGKTFWGHMISFGLTEGNRWNLLHRFS